MPVKSSVFKIYRFQNLPTKDVPLNRPGIVGLILINLLVKKKGLTLDYWSEKRHDVARG